MLTPSFTATRSSCPIPDSGPHITALHTIFRQVFTPDYHFCGEVHDFWELVCVLEGRVSITADERVFALEAGQAIIHAPMQFHNIGSLGGTAPKVLVITFSGDNIPSIQDRVCRIHDPAQLEALYDLACRAFRIQQVWVWEAVDTSRSLRFAKELEALLLRLADHTQERESSASRRAKLYTMAVKIMENNLQQRLTVEDIAQQCYTSKIALQKTFAKYAGIGVMEYYNRLRIQAAADLLATGASVKEAATAAGFADQNYFSTVFKRVTGLTPTRSKRKT